MPPTLVFTTSSSLVSSTIRVLTDCAASHVAVGTEVFGVQVLFHAALDVDAGVSGIQIMPRSKWLRSNVVVAEYEIIPNVSANLAGMVELVGESYNMTGLVGYVIVLAAKWLGKFIKNPFSKPNAFVCPKYVLRLDPQRLLIDEWKDLDPDITTPAQLLKICQNSDSFCVLFDKSLNGKSC